jgi:hypothetical protein
MIATVMSRYSESPSGNGPWEPEPLRLPVAREPRRRTPRSNDHEAGRDPSDDRDDDLPGSHVIVIELA